MVCDATTHSPLRNTATLMASLTTIAAVAAVMSAAPAAAATGATPVIGQEPDVAVFLPGGLARNCDTYWLGGPDFVVER